MVRRLAPALAASLLLAGLTWSAGSNATAQEPPAIDTSQQLSVYTGVVSKGSLQSIVDLGVDRHELEVTAIGDGQVAVEVVLTNAQADALSAKGTRLTAKSVGSAQRTTALQTGVFRRYGGEGGIQEELEDQAASTPADRSAAGHRSDR